MIPYTHARTLRKAFEAGETEAYCAIHAVWEYACRDRDYELAKTMDSVEERISKLHKPSMSASRVRVLDNFMKVKEAA